MLIRSQEDVVGVLSAIPCNIVIVLAWLWLAGFKSFKPSCREGKKRLENTISSLSLRLYFLYLQTCFRILSECLKQPHLRAPAREALFPVWMASSTMDYGMVMATLQKERSDTTWT